MQAASFKYVFGPVLSGRLGRSLGLDLLGSRTCSMNCVYCESRPLARLTLTRASYVPAAALLAELAAWEAGRARCGEPLPDVVSLGGLGEPTLNSELAAIIKGVRSILPGVPVAVLTNASLMIDPAVRAELVAADIVLPSLDSLVPDEFARVNRAHPGLASLGGVQAVADGILAFRSQFSGKLYLEVLLVAGVNDSEQNLQLLADYCKRLKPDRVDVVTLSRPGTEASARPVDVALLARWRGVLAGHAPAGLAGSVEKGHIQAGGMSLDEVWPRILASLERRPQTAAQLASALLAPESLVVQALAELSAQGSVESIERDPTYFQVRRGA